jgi:hypothetical protein
MTARTLIDAAGRTRSPATMPNYRTEKSPANKGRSYPPDPPRVEEIVAVTRGPATQRQKFAPEVFFGEECGGKKASRSMKKMLDPGDRVKLVRDRSQDNRYRSGRLLRYVEREKRDVGRKQVRSGWAKVFVFERAFKRVGKYRRGQNRAKAGDRGVWSRCGGDFHQAP